MVVLVCLKLVISLIRCCCGCMCVFDCCCSADRDPLHHYLHTEKKEKQRLATMLTHIYTLIYTHTHTNSVLCSTEPSHPSVSPSNITGRDTTGDTQVTNQIQNNGSYPPILSATMVTAKCTNTYSLSLFPPSDSSHRWRV